MFRPFTGLLKARQLRLKNTAHFLSVALTARSISRRNISPRVLWHGNASHAPSVQALR